MLTRPSSIQLLVPVYLCDPSLYPVVEDFFSSLAEHYPDLDLIVADGASPLPIPENWPVSFRNETNIGYTATVNRLLKASTADILIVANNDLKFKGGDLDRFFTLKGLVIASPRDTASSPDDRFGSIFGLTRQTLDKLGYLNEEYRNYFSDRDYYDRAKKAGVEVVKWNDITIDHVESATFKTLDKETLISNDAEVYEQNQKLA